MRICRVIIASILVICLVISPICAVDQLTATDDTLEIESVLTSFIMSYLDSIYLYQDAQFSEFTIASIDNELSVSSSIELSSLISLQENIDFLGNKVAYFRYAREAQGIYRTDFNAELEINNLSIDTDAATAIITAKISFQYTDAAQPSYLEEVYFVDLLKVNNVWLITDMTESNCWFDSDYKNSPDFEIDSLISQLQIDLANQASDNTTIAETQIQPTNTISPMASTRTLSYNKANATAYAYTYTTSVESNTATDFYNDNFSNQNSNGGDCMNFVSQCIWAGFGGSNDAYSINNKLSPMDTVGSYVWYGTDDTSICSSSWISCSGFRRYQENQSATEVGLHTTKYDISSGASFASISNYADVLPGSLLHVNSGSTDYAHAIIVTDVYGPGRNEVYFCGHSSMRKYIKVGDRHPSCPIYVYQPTSFITNIPITMRNITATLYRPVPAGTQLSLTATTDLSCYKITTTVTTPSGTSSTTTTYNLTTATRNYTFTETGLYTIQVSVFTTSSSTATSYYYTIRTY